MRNLSFALALMLGTTGCFVGRGMTTAYNRAMTVGTTVFAPAVATSSAVSSNVTVNGQPATATVAVGPNGMAVAAGGPGASVSASVGVPGQ